MFEVVIMVSPFAFYFYAAYGPTLKWLNHSAATAWLTGFMLPHAVFTTSPFLEFLRWDLGRYFFGLGLLAFFVLAAQIYGSKLFGRKLVNSGIYRYIRHPQYLSLGLSAFGLFTMWPRMIIFLLFVGMLFAYYFLARVEERRMLAIDHTYADYMRGTGMFLPGNPGGRLYRRLFGNLREQKFARRLALTSLLVLVLPAAFACVPHCAAYCLHRRVTERGSRRRLPHGSYGDATSSLFGSVRPLRSTGLAAGGERHFCRACSATRLWDDRNVCRCWHPSHDAWKCSLVAFQVSVRMASAISRFSRAH
jgi:protein-S-isoprenylcysteine O-methyltransferase Ste14